MGACAPTAADLGNPEVKNARLPQTGHIADRVDNSGSGNCPKRAADQKYLGRHNQIDDEIAVRYASEHLWLSQRPEYRRAVQRGHGLAPDGCDANA